MKRLAVYQCSSFRKVPPGTQVAMPPEAASFHPKPPRQVRRPERRGRLPLFLRRSVPSTLQPHPRTQQLAGRDLRFGRKDPQQWLILQHIIEDRRGKPRRARGRADRRRREPSYVEEASHAAGVVRQELKKAGDKVCLLWDRIRQGARQRSWIFSCLFRASLSASASSRGDPARFFNEERINDG